MEEKMPGKKKVLLVEDEPGVTRTIKEWLHPYKDQIDLEYAATAEEALAKLYRDNDDKPLVDALILDIMLPYGTEDIRTILEGEGDTTGIDTGILLLRHIREKETKAGSRPLWITVITGRNAPDVMQRLNDLLMENGRLLTKPVNEVVLVNDIALVLAIESKVPQILLPDGYKPPIRQEVPDES